MRFSSFLSKTAVLIACTVAAVGPGSRSVYAQAHKETAIQAMRLHVFGVGSYVHPAYGVDQTGSGFAVGGGAGFTVHHVHYLEPSLDLRYQYASSPSVTETVLSGGLRVILHAAKFHPYGDILVGTGNLDIKKVNPAFPNYKHDDSTVYTFGGGLDYDLTQTVGFRIDVQQQRWQLATTNLPFYPTQASIGVRYQFHFRNQNGPE